MSEQPTSRITQLILLPIVTAILIGGLVLGFYAINHQALLELGDESKNRLTLFVSNLNGSLARHEYLPRLISLNSKLLNTLSYRDPVRVNVANQFLQSVVTATGASDAYLMDADGSTLAASNWQKAHSFVGKNFSFRPYFTMAIKGQPARYFALGTTSLQRGYYFSHPVNLHNEVAGVVVVKINLAEIEAAWTDRGYHFLVTDEDGIIFLSTKPEWTYKSLAEISPQRTLEIVKSRRYSDHKIEHLRVRNITALGNNLRLLGLIDKTGNTESEYLQVSREMKQAGWTVHLLSDTTSIHETLILRLTLAGFAALSVLLLISLYLVNRQRRLALQQSTLLLEKRVHKRTEELRNEIEERKKAEQTLRDTQSELIQAAKLAGLGQMSAGISHELNQPLTAIRNYSQNTQHMLERQQIEAACSNLIEIETLTKYMAGIISQLRGFSRKSTGEQSLVSIKQSAEQAISLFRAEVDKSKIQINLDIDPEITVTTDPLLLNQVLVNLLSNSIQAMQQCDTRRIDVNMKQSDSDICIRLSDTGTGISDKVIENIFDPFFTTKEVGLGLGLGLSICYRIMQSLGGRIGVANITSGGACFELYLPYE
ncbi:MAG: sensor histidine kinase [Gammaproteobacteria bacterium]|nr:sensor histidine kinase [Gammaproteobacteria bacterium]